MKTECRQTLATAYTQSEQVAALLVLLQSYTERFADDPHMCGDDYACTVGHALAAARTLADCVAEEVQNYLDATAPAKKETPQ